MFRWFTPLVIVPWLLCNHFAYAGERVVLDNGLTLLMQPIADVDHVAVEAFYEIGFVDEPKGMDQAAHLLEHLVCYGASESFAQKEAMQKLNRIGMANAETLPTCTHYDYVLPANDLSLAIQIEKERLTSLVIASTIQLPFLVAQLQVQATSLNPNMVRQHAKMIQKMRGVDEQRAIGLVLGQAAINWAMWDRLMGTEADKTALQIGLMLGGKLNQLIDDTLDETKMLVAHVVPAP